MGYKVAVVGATGNVGREMLAILAEREFPVDEIFALASSRSQGREISFGDKTIKCQNLENFDPSKADLALFSAGGSISEKFGPRFAAAGCIVIDNSSHFRYHSDIPLIIPEVNADAVVGVKNRNIIANPNCSTMQMLVALKPLHDAFTIKRLVVSTYQSVSGGGTAAMDELFNQTRGIFVNDAMEQEIFTKQIAFNVIPHIDVFMEDGYTKEEWKLMAETKKILDPKIKVTATAVRVPVFIGHSEAINIEFEKPVTAEAARELMRVAPGLLVVDKRDDGGYVTPVEAVGEDATYVSRIREDATVENGLNIWVVSDNLRKGAALNTVQIAELLVNRNLL
ncbi:MAG: aspartate-semialdehyde dehydrogenase [Hyphomicrobiales bacterium]|nr:MAG: aspartate-semialdehyde dehydrogenase [Hyphomicrobiales bacterium]